MYLFLIQVILLQEGPRAQQRGAVIRAFSQMGGARQKQWRGSLWLHRFLREVIAAPSPSPSSAPRLLFPIMAARAFVGSEWRGGMSFWCPFACGMGYLRPAVSDGTSATHSLGPSSSFLLSDSTSFRFFLLLLDLLLLLLFTIMVPFLRCFLFSFSFLSLL